MSDCVYVPRECFSAQAAAFAALHSGVATRGFVANIEAQVDTIDAGNSMLPVIINGGIHENAWVCSPLTTYSRYALEETRRVVPRALAAPLGGVIGVAHWWLRRAEIDRAVSVNNWLLSTNLYPAAEGIDFGALAAACQLRWPNHSVWFRSLNFAQHADWLHALAAAGYDLIPTRQVYLFRNLQRSATKHQNLRRDLQLLRSTPLTRVSHREFTRADFEQSEALYAQLYLNKYSRLNPHYTTAFLQAWHRAGLLEFAGFRDNTGVLRAVVGMFGRGSLLSAPIVGYDTGWPASAGLYRLLMAHVLDATREREAILNLSAGAAHFKQLRGGEPQIEYSAVLSHHLPAATRQTLRGLRMLTTTLGVPIMRRFKL